MKSLKHLKKKLDICQPRSREENPIHFIKAEFAICAPIITIPNSEKSNCNTLCGNSLSWRAQGKSLVGRYFVSQEKLWLSDSSPTCLEPVLPYRFHRAEPLHELRFPATTENRLCITTSTSWLIINLCNEHLFWPCQQYREKSDKRKAIEIGRSFRVYFFPPKNAHRFQADIRNIAFKHSRRLILTDAAAP